MRIVLLGFGSRGDVQPLIALGQGLQRAGYTVALAAGMNFAGWIEQEGLLFEPFHLDIEALMKTDLGKAWLGDSSARPWEELQNMRRMANAVAATVIDDLLALSARYDVFISGLLTVEAVATLAQAHGKRHLLALFAPLAPTRAGHAGMQALLPHSESALNRWWGYAIQAMLFTTLRGVSGTLRARLKLPPPTRRDFWRACNRTPSLVGVSPLVPWRPFWRGVRPRCTSVLAACPGATRSPPHN
ncbi:MAG: glycosyltransferase [Anaerolineae bacterium]|nr:glycosyltransferase [Anaerolineae bacterium]